MAAIVRPPIHGIRAPLLTTPPSLERYNILQRIGCLIALIFGAPLALLFNRRDWILRMWTIVRQGSPPIGNLPPVAPMPPVAATAQPVPVPPVAVPVLQVAALATPVPAVAAVIPQVDVVAAAVRIAPVALPAQPLQHEMQLFVDRVLQESPTRRAPMNLTAANGERCL